MPHLFREAADIGSSFSLLNFIVMPLLSAALVGAGTAWLLDRIVFRVQPFEAGGRTVE
jgi:nitrate reductase NapE component